MSVEKTNYIISSNFNLNAGKHEIRLVSFI